MRILIAEDEFVSRRLLLGVLSAYGTCDTANDGLQAREAIHDAWQAGSPYRLVCLDLLMPNCDGLQFLNELRAFEREQAVDEADRARVIITTAVDELPSIARAFQAGCDAYLTKPVDRRKLLDKLRDLELVSPGPERQELGCSGEARKRVADETAALLRKATGKGPLGVKVYVDGSVLTLVVEGALTPLERALLDEGGRSELVDLVRSSLLEVIGGELRSIFRRELGVTVADLYSHLDSRRDKQIIVARAQEPHS